ncbi:YlxQ family RNA-binding protein [Paenibacillus chitinolyticus]|uniref:50S ribosomal protein L7ae n=1 Tax=Paenibacillus chitinolyticus TaxID=79263 RepID=A0A410X047_9BACL|nr:MULTISPECIES: YlxQ family RNA-binding protein [Paenibacillus]MCY9592918.1 YlxQ family RNA-binding protein [Paenibacillus chitinolyticus]MCY9595889.1 YlxQ family RNA-binding protein [Paenibacillus chitinolyticus]QAV20044.1 50S ribosomal protein L7ae [Paenibacillus chitinolyticus]GKS09982.1 50S ribosomal protein L7ae [Paenibacillus chitinolyticus]
MTNKNYFSNLGLAMRAGKLVTGEESVLKAIRSGEAKLVILAEDAADNTSKKFQDKCRSYDVPLLVLGNREELGSSIGKEARVTIAVVDDGFARMLKKYRV